METLSTSAGWEYSKPRNEEAVLFELGWVDCLLTATVYCLGMVCGNLYGVEVG